MSDEIAARYEARNEGFYGAGWCVYRVRKMGGWEDVVAKGLAEADALSLVNKLEGARV